MTELLGSRAILVPVVALVAWTLIMLLWMYAKRMPALAKADKSALSKPGLRGNDLDGVLDDKVQWSAHNYNHLMEQPTIFYAIAISLALLGAGGGISLIFAWLYVGFRVAHSITQATVNLLPIRFMLFIASSLCLFVLTIRAIMVLAQA